jgi:hypothetical protein
MLALAAFAHTASAQPRPPDVVFLVDTTGDMAGPIVNLQASFTALIVPVLTSSHPGIGSGVAFFRDFPVAPYGLPAPPDYPYLLAQTVTTNTVAAQAALNQANVGTGGSGGDLEESGNEALYQLAAGTGVSWPGGALAPSDVGFRTGSPRVAIVITKAAFHETYAGFTAHSSTEALAALAEAGVKVAAVSAFNGSVNLARPGLEAYARATGARVAATLLSMSGQCPTLIGGVTRPPDADGTCPLVFDVASNGTGLGPAALQAIDALLQDLIFQDGFNAGT